jgi:hypothetical protein
MKIKVPTLTSVNQTAPARAVDETAKRKLKGAGRFGWKLPVGKADGTHPNGGKRRSSSFSPSPGWPRSCAQGHAGACEDRAGPQGHPKAPARGPFSNKK